MARTKIGMVHKGGLKGDKVGFHAYMDITLVGHNGKTFPMKAMIDTGSGPCLVLTYRQAMHCDFASTTYRRKATVRLGNNSVVECGVYSIRIMDDNNGAVPIEAFILEPTKDDLSRKRVDSPNEDDMPVVGLSAFEGKFVVFKVADEGEFSESLSILEPLLP